MAKKGIFHNKAFKRVQGFIYGAGAAVVIVGALFKILHLPGANLMLMVGLGTEAFIFLMSAFEPPHEDLPWERVYPELEDDYLEAEEYKKVDKKGSVTEQLDDALEKANIESEMLERLGKNMGKLGDNIEKMSEIADVAGATSDFSAKTKEATDVLSNMKIAYQSATDSVKELAESSAGTKDYHEQVQRISQNLASLNAMYEVELQDTKSHLNAMNKFYGNLTEAMNNLEEAKGDAMQYKVEIAALSKNLASLNKVYGNMLSAMKNPLSE